ncbi:hypothetical protein H5407_20475 [Mitsuaria sp. WAJ17]|uniref:hypothetical protein n=1 Tax=Mitsuaria sp. WAJ17 TaxID=2761452 RepID=UPI001601E2EA|nr:hypothetical protein [Mitsuaria sp. WAJ17]MBB2487618.1 hypothetical protein [Mitsuaria sp. WAJ17]
MKTTTVTLGLALLLSHAMIGSAQAQKLPPALARLQQQVGPLDYARDVQPLLAALNGRESEQQQWAALKLLSSLLDRDARQPVEITTPLRPALAAQLLAFARQERFSAMKRDDALMLLREIQADAASLAEGIQLAEAESAKGRPHFGNTARLLRLHQERMGAAGAGRAVDRAEPAPAATTSAAAPAPRDFHSQMVAAQQAMSAQDYPRVMQLVQGLEADLKRRDPGFAEKEEWAWVLDFKRFTLYETGRIPEALASCRLAVQKLIGSADWAYLESYNIVRSTRRACHNMLAHEGMEKARSLAELQEAIEHIDAVFDIGSPIEDEGVHDAFFETRLRVYLKAAAWDPKGYREPLLQALSEAQRREVALPEDWPELDTLRRSADYQRYRKAHAAAQD